MVQPKTILVRKATETKLIQNFIEDNWRIDEMKCYDWNKKERVVWTNLGLIMTDHKITDSIFTPFCTAVSLVKVIFSGCVFIIKIEPLTTRFAAKCSCDWPNSLWHWQLSSPPFQLMNFILLLSLYNAMSFVQLSE